MRRRIGKKLKRIGVMEMKPEKKSLAAAVSTRLPTDVIKTDSQISQVKDVVKNICDSKRIISHTSYSYKLGKSIVKSHRIIMERG
jgi:hypothetical protein